MLVLSRQKNQRIRFPGLGITVEILEVKGAKVRVGIDAPIEVRVLRDELEEYAAPPKQRDAVSKRDATAPSDTSSPTQSHIIKLTQGLRHELRNELHELSLMLHVYHERAKQQGGADASEVFDPEQMFQTIIERLEKVGKHDAISPRGVFSPGPSTVNASTAVGDALVVDDDDNERELLAGFLRMCNYQVHTASDGLQGVKFMQTNPAPRVILLDMNMPRCSGGEFLHAIRQVKAWDSIPVIVISGNTPEEVNLSPNDGYTHWFHKPLDPRRVVEQLAKIGMSNATVA